MKTYDLPEYESKRTDFKILDNIDDFLEDVRLGNNIVAIDTETYYDPDNKGVIRYIYGTPNNMPFCLTATIKIGDDYVTYYFDIDPKDPSKDLGWIEAESITKILHNFHYDEHILRNIGLSIKGTVWDTMIMIHLIDEEHECKFEDGSIKQSKALKNLAYHYLDKEAHFYEDLIQEYRKGLSVIRECGISDVSYKDIAEHNFDAMRDYACSDTLYTYRLWELFLPRLQNQQLDKAYDIDLKATWAVIDMERVGILPDTAYFLELDRTLNLEIARIDKEIKELGIPDHLNINSNADVVEMFSMLDTEWKWYTPKGEFQVTDAVLHNITTGKAGELAKLIRDRRERTKMVDTFIAQMLEYTQPDGRIHPDFNVCPKDDSRGGTVTGRLSSSNPNFQNLPSGDDRIRKGIIPTKDFTLVSIDYAQQEYRLMAAYANDRTLNKIIEDGIDIHTGTAALMLDITPEEAVPQRHLGKTINFSLIYGTGKANLANMLGYEIDVALYNKAVFMLMSWGYKPWQKYPSVLQLCEKHEVTNAPDILALEYYFSEHPKPALKKADDLKKKYFAQFPGVSDFINGCNSRAKIRGYALMWDGRRRHFKSPAKDSYKATNACIQGGCGAITKMKMWECTEFLRPLKSRLVNVVHDEIVFEVHKDEMHIIPTLKAMMEAVAFKVPFPASVEMSDTNWGEMEAIE